MLKRFSERKNVDQTLIKYHRKYESLFKKSFVMEKQIRISSKNRKFEINDLKVVIQHYFHDDKEFQELPIETTWNLLYENGHILGLDTCTERFKYNKTEKIDLKDQSILVEEKRIPLLASIKNVLPTSNLNTILDDLIIGRNDIISAFAGKTTTINQMLNPQKRFDISRSSEAKPVHPLSIVADMSEYKHESMMSTFVNNLNSEWNLFFSRSKFYGDRLQSLKQSSLVLSDMGAISSAHIHPYMFTNFAFNGTKVYMLFDVDEDIVSTPFFNIGTTNLHTGSNVNKTNKYHDILNAKVTRKLSFNEFLSRKRSFFTFISSSVEQNNFILVPSFYAHEVYTIGTGKDEIYSGLSGFALPLKIAAEKEDDVRELLENALSKEK